MKVNINSIRSLYIEVYFNDIKLATATGFLVRKDNTMYLITNRHVVTGRNNETNECLDKNLSIPNRLDVWFPYLENDNYTWTKISVDLYDDDSNDKKWMEHPTFKEKVDVVAIKLGCFNSSMFCYNIDTFYKTIVTDKVFIIGYPFGFDVRPKEGKYAIWSTGTVASDPDLDLNISGEQLPCFLVDAKTRQGQSGSPVIYYSSVGLDKTINGIGLFAGPIIHEIGVYSGRINKDSDLGYVWKWSLIKEIIEQ